MMRTHRAGDVRATDIGDVVAVCGWVAHRRDHGGKVFLDVRDAAGILQVVVDPATPGLEVAHRIRGEWVVRVHGTVSARPGGNGQLRSPDGRGRGGRRRARGAERVRARRRSRSTTASTSTRCCG